MNDAHLTPWRRSRRALLVPFALFGALACSSGKDPHFSSVEAAGGADNAEADGIGAGTPSDGPTLVGDGSGDQASGVSGDDGDAGAPDPYTLPPSVTFGDAGVVLCGNEVCRCNNGVDDDGDGKLDGFDEECTGALDDDEASFATGISGDNSDPKWQDCFFDGNSGAGDDHCRYHTDCLSGAKPASDPDCFVSATCRDFCQQRTPNGCDCFGCCTVQLENATTVDVFIGTACSLEDVDDPVKCPRCTPSAECVNTCGTCELCPGKSVEDLPESCSQTPPGGGDPDVPTYTCQDGQSVCSGAAECPSGQYCSLGCCLAFVIR
jgi:hypothetical protein